jgi:ABC-type molybdate transport system substrate-binding protein
MLSPTNFKSYEELKKDLEWVTFEDVNKNSVTSSGTPSVSVAERVQSQAPVEINTASAASTSAANDELDSLLAGLL